MIRIKFLFLLCIFMSSFSLDNYAQNSKKTKTLTEIFQIISKKKKVNINYNPSVANRIHIADVTSEKDVVESLNRLLVDYDLEIKSAGPTYLYVTPLQKFVLQGMVVDEQSSKPIPCTIIMDGKKTVTTTSGGKFSFSLHKGTYRIAIKENAFLPKSVSISLSSSRNMIIKLKKKEQKIIPVVIQLPEKEEKKLQVPAISYPVPDSVLALQPMIPDSLPHFFIGYHPVDSLSKDKSTDFMLKLNMIMWAKGITNIAVEKKITGNVTAEILLGIKPIKYDEKENSISYLIQPEIKFWLLRSFEGFFIGYHTYYAHYGAGDIIFPYLRKGVPENNRNAGYLYGMGASCGYYWPISKHWNLEAVVGVGYIHMVYDKTLLNNLMNKKGRFDYNYFGLTKAAINLIYAF